MKTELTARNDLFIAQSGVLNVAKINKISKMQYLIYTIKSDRSIKDQSKYERENK